MTEQEIQQMIDNSIQKYDRSSLKVPRHTHNGVDSPQINPKDLLSYSYYIAPGVIVVLTNGTAPQNIFGTNTVAPFNFKYTQILTVSTDTTAGNITVSNNGNTVSVIAKGSSVGNLAAAGAVSNQNQVQGTPATVVSSSAGNAFIIIFFTAL